LPRESSESTIPSLGLSVRRVVAGAGV
jgi:hypothetical protein